jgi:PAS domain-containing protein/HAMP domain-containing protein
MKFRFTLVNRLYSGFGFVTLAVVFSSALTFFTLQSNKRISEQVSQIYTPSIVYLNDLINIVNDSRMLIKNWVFIEHKSQTPDKIKLQNLHAKDYPRLSKNLDALKLHWGDAEVFLINSIEKTLTDTLFPMHMEIMSQLNSFEAYDDPMVIFEIRPMVEEGGEVMVTTDKVLEMLRNLRTLINKKGEEINSQMFQSMGNFQRTIIIMGFILVIVSLATAYFISQATVKPVLRLREFLLTMTRGVLPDDHMNVSNDEIGDMSQALNQFVDSMKETSKFALEIGKGNFSANYSALGEEDILGNSLLTMREDLKRAYDEEQRRKREDEIRNWTTQGLAKFGDILRQSSNIDSLSYNVVENALEFMGAIQGALYILEDSDEHDIHFKMAAAVAYGRRKLVTRRNELEEGLVGRCAFERATVYLKQVPQDYVRITSGLGDANPTVILLVPLLANEKIYGVVEIASFNPFEDYQIKFLEQVSENIAGTLATVKINEKTARLLEESQQKGEELAAQEEEMRQNMEELQATQEESARREVEMREIFEAINNTIGNIEIDLFGIVSSVNDKYAQMLNLKTGEIIGREHKNLIKLTSKQELRYREMWEGFEYGTPAEIDLCYPTSFGDIWLRETYTPLKNAEGTYTKVLALVVDVTDNKTKDRAIHAYKRELDEQSQSLKQVIEQLSQLKDQFEQRERELLKENEIAEEENRVQIESMRLQIEELEERLNRHNGEES